MTQWQMLPRLFGPWSTVYAYCRRWRLSGTWEQLHTRLRETVRQQSRRTPTTSPSSCAATFWYRSRTSCGLDLPDAPLRTD